MEAASIAPGSPLRFYPAPACGEADRVIVGFSCKLAHRTGRVKIVDRDRRLPEAPFGVTGYTSFTVSSGNPVHVFYEAALPSYTIWTRRFCGSLTPSAVGTSRSRLPLATISISDEGMPSFSSWAATDSARRRLRRIL